MEGRRKVRAKPARPSSLPPRPHRRFGDLLIDGYKQKMTTAVTILLPSRHALPCLGLPFLAVPRLAVPLMRQCDTPVVCCDASYHALILNNTAVLIQYNCRDLPCPALSRPTHHTKYNIRYTPSRGLLQAHLSRELRDVVLPVHHLHLLVVRERVPFFVFFFRS